jgi:GAF domain-containing protein
MRVVIPIGAELFYERDFNKLLERILVEAKTLSQADAGTLYLVREDDRLEFIIVHNTTLGIAMGGTTGVSPPFDSLRIRSADGQHNHRNIATHVALTGFSVNIADAYAVEGFDFAGTREFDSKTGYRSVSFVAVPLKNTQGRVIGVLQMINAIDPQTGRIIPFHPLRERAIESLGLIAAAALEQHVREQGLRSRIQELNVEIDQVKRERQVREITESDYFRGLQEKLAVLRRRSRPSI